IFIEYIYIYSILADNCIVIFIFITIINFLFLLLISCFFYFIRTFVNFVNIFLMIRRSSNSNYSVLGIIREINRSPFDFSEGESELVSVLKK
ncbi:hypothetical protein FWK35_00010991, partial [Aphis craccivora]